MTSLRPGLFVVQLGRLVIKVLTEDNLFVRTSLGAAQSLKRAAGSFGLAFFDPVCFHLNLVIYRDSSVKIISDVPSLIPLQTLLARLDM